MAFIDGQELVIANKPERYSFIGFGNYIYKNVFTLTQMKHWLGKSNDFYKIFKYNRIGIIDRSNKIVLFTKNLKVTSFLRGYFDNDWYRDEIDDMCVNDYLLTDHNEEAYYKMIAKSAAMGAIKDISRELLVINGNINTLYEYKMVYAADVKRILEGINERYNITDCNWAKEPFIYTINVKHPNNGNFINIEKAISINDIIDNKIFTESENLLLEQRNVWTEYCRGKGISFKTLQERWNDHARLTDLPNEVYNNYKYCIKTLSFREVLYISNSVREKSNIKHQYACSKKSEENFNKTIDAMSKIDIETIVKHWRDGSFDKRYNYEYFVTYGPIKTLHTLKPGRWVIKPVHTIDCEFIPTTKLRLIKKKGQQYVETLTSAYVNIKDAINAFELLMRKIDKYKVEVERNKDFTIDIICANIIYCGNYHIRVVGRNYVRNRITDDETDKLD